MIFKKIKEVSIEKLISLGFKENDYVIVLLENGLVKHGKLVFIKNYNTLFPVQLSVDEKTIDIYSSIGITHVIFN